jgi:alkylresorcinol/alkylpyrone synthase
VNDANAGTGPRIWAVGTATPPHVLSQADVRAFARGFFSRDLPHIDRLLGAFDHTGIETRHLACPLSWYETPHSFAEKNEIYRRVAVELGHEAAERALQQADVARSDIAAIVLVSSTGLSTPSLDGALLQRLDLPRTAHRVPIWGLGCAGGAAGLARAADLVRSSGRPVLLVCVEVCSTTFMYDDRSKSNLIATALFGDGAAAVVVGPERAGLELVGGHSLLLDDTEDVMGWDLRDGGLQVRFARSIPEIVRRVAPDLIEQCAREAGLSPETIRHFVLHPGGAKVLAAYEAVLSVPRARIGHAWAVLASHGNMSSPTVLFVLQRFLADTAPTGAPGLLVGLGPGFSAEGVSFRW